jgi:hypothetical protein
VVWVSSQDVELSDLRAEVRRRFFVKYVSEVLSDVVRNAKNIVAADSSALLYRDRMAWTEQTSQYEF